MTIPTITDDLIAELERFAYNTEYSADADMAMNAIETIRQLEKDAADKDARIAELVEEVDDLHYEVCEAMQAKP